MLTDKDHSDLLVYILTLLADCLVRTPDGDRRDNLEEARTALLRGIQTYEHHQQWHEWADLQFRLGNVYGDRLAENRSNSIEESIGCYLRALGIWRENGRAADAEYNLAVRYLQRIEGERVDNVDAAIVHLNAAAKVYARDRQSANLGLAQNLLDKCVCELADGATCQEEALEMPIIRSHPISWADATLDWGTDFDNQLSGNHAENIETARKILQSVLEELAPESDPDQWAKANYEMGRVYSHRVRGDRRENEDLAIRHLNEALRFLDRAWNPVNWSNAHQALGLVHGHRVVGDPVTNRDLSIFHYEQALQALTPDRAPQNWAMIKRSLGLAYLFKAPSTVGSDDVDRVVRQASGGREDVDRAVHHLEDALTALTQDKHPHAWALIKETLASVYLEQPSADSALEDVERAISLFRSTIDMFGWLSDPDGVARSRIGLALALQRHAQISGQDSRQERAELLGAVLEVCTIESRPSVCAGVAGLLGEVFAELGQWAEAADAFQNSIAATESLYVSSLTTATRQRHLADARTAPRWAAYALAKSGRAEEAVVVLERGRARALGDAVDRDQANLESLRESHPQLIQAYLDAVEELRRLQDVELDSSLGGTESRLTELAERARSAQADLTKKIERIRRIGGYEDFLTAPDLSTVTAAAESDAPIAYLNTTPWGTITLLVVRTGPDTTEVRTLWADDFTEDDVTQILTTSTSPDSTLPLFSGYLMRMLDLYETQLDDTISVVTMGPWKGPGRVVRAPRDEDGDVAIFGQRVVAGLARALAAAGVPRVVMIPCGTLGNLPAHTALYQENPTPRCLLDDVDVAFAPSARVLSRARDRARRQWHEPVLAGVGNPLPHPNPLVFAGCELEQIARLFERGTCLHGEQATKDEVLRSAGSATHVHLACHGTYRLGDRSPHLALAHAEQLSSTEITRNRPFAGSRLVVLSACQTAITGTEGNPDEVVGLPTAIMLAGTPGVIATLWAVDDLSTRLLMERFYTLHLRGDPQIGESPMTPCRALRHAQRWLATVTAAELHHYFLQDDVPQQTTQNLTSGRRHPAAEAAMNAVRFGLEEPHNQPFSNPYYWAPFVFIGE